MKLGLLGGTFDPIHWGHLRSAEEVCEAFSLDRVVFVPCSQPPHRKNSPGSSGPDRLEMVRLAVAENPFFDVSDVELKRPGKSYSIDTLRHFARIQPGASLYFVLGLDAFLEMGSWKDVQEIFPLCHLIVTSRPGREESMSLETIPVAVRSGFCYDRNERFYRHRSGTHLYFIKLTDLAISASQIRELLSRRRSIRYLVPSEVAAYIHRKGLYGGHQGGHS